MTKKSSRPRTSQFQIDANTESKESIFFFPKWGHEPDSEQASVVVRLVRTLRENDSVLNHKLRPRLRCQSQQPLLPTDYITLPISPLDSGPFPADNGRYSRGTHLEMQ